MAVNTFTGTAAWSSAGDWSDGVPTSDDTLTIDGDCTNDQDGVGTSLLVNATRELDMATYDIPISGAVVVNGDLVMGTSGAGGIEGDPITINSGAVVDLQVGSVITANGDYTCHNSSIWANNDRGEFHQAGNGTYINVNNANKFDKFYIDLDVTFTIGANGCKSVNWSATNMEAHILGTIDATTTWYIIDIAITTGGIFELGASCDLIDGNIKTFLFGSPTITKSKTSFPSFVGTWQDSISQNNCILLTMSTPSARRLLRLSDSSDRSGNTFEAGTIECNDFHMNCNSAARTHGLKADTNNPLFVINGSEDWDTADSGYTLNYDKGTGSRTLQGSGTESLKYIGSDVEAIVLNATGTYEVEGDFSCTSLSGSQGTLQSDVAGTERTITVDGTGTANNCTFKDIHMNAAGRVNAKSGGSSGGNTLGIVFEDSFGEF